MQEIWVLFRFFVSFLVVHSVFSPPFAHLSTTVFKPVLIYLYSRTAKEPAHHHNARSCANERGKDPNCFWASSFGPPSITQTPSPIPVNPPLASLLSLAASEDPGLAAATSLFVLSLTTKRQNAATAASPLLFRRNSSVLDSLASSPTPFWSTGGVEAALTGEKSHGAWGKMRGGNSDFAPPLISTPWLGFSG